MENGFKINKYDKYICVKDTNESYVILFIYVDDMFIVVCNYEMIKSTIHMFEI